MKKSGGRQRQGYLLMVACGVFCLGISFPFAVSADMGVVPGQIHYRGMLTDADGNPLSTEKVTLSFRLFDDFSGGTAKWGPQTIENVVVTNGFFDVALGPEDVDKVPLVKALSSPVMYIEVGMGEDRPLAPRQELVTTPYATISSRGVPIGAIIPWVPPRPVTSLEEARALLPEEFVICSGPLADDPKTRFDESRVPNLLDQRFLKGGSVAGVGAVGVREHAHPYSPNTDAKCSNDPNDSEMIAHNYADQGVWCTRSDDTCGYSYHPVVGTTTWGTCSPRHVSVFFVMRVK